MHLIFRDQDKNPDKILGQFKSYTSKVLQKEIQAHAVASRKEWILWMLKKAGAKESNVKNAML